MILPKNPFRFYPYACFLILILGAVWIFLSPVSDSAAAGSLVTAPRQGFQAPDFELLDLTGTVIRLSDLKGSAVVLNFWASWCPPCKAEMPAFQKIHLAYQDEQLQVLAINATTQDNLAKIHEFIRDNQLTLHVLLDSEGSVETTYMVQALPTTFFIDKEGIIRNVMIGGPLPEALLYAEIVELLQEKH
jgi:cytochrome c biogenesis protein CcmG/thiol:disulfide interchange protein DsbE